MPQNKKSKNDIFNKSQYDYTVKPLHSIQNKVPPKFENIKQNTGMQDNPTWPKLASKFKHIADNIVKYNGYWKQNLFS